MGADHGQGLGVVEVGGGDVQHLEVVVGRAAVGL